MNVLKSYSGTVSNNTTVSRVKTYFSTSNISVHGGKTDAFNEILESFLQECHVDASYDGNFLWIDGVPFHFYFSGTNVFFNLYFPNNETAVTGSTSIGAIFNGLNYNFDLKLIGEPKSCFWLMVSTNYTTKSFSTGSFSLGMAKGKNIFDDSDVRLYKAAFYNGGTTGYGNSDAPYACELDDDGKFLDIGHSITAIDKTYFNYRIGTISNDFSVNQGKLPLVKCMNGPFIYNDVYQLPLNSGLNASSSANNSVPYFYFIDGETYFAWYYGLVRCYTEL